MQVEFMPYAYFEGRIVPMAEAKISIASQVVQYGEGVFGGIRGYLDQDGQTLNIFRLRDHARRFSQSAGLIKVALPFDVDGLCELFVELAQRNAPTSDVYFRPFAYKAGLDLGPTLTGIDDGFALYMMPLGDYLRTNGISLMVSSWRRVNDNAIPARGKVSGAYVNSAIIRDEANQYGFDDAIVLNDRGKVSEASAANLMMIRSGVLVTPPVTADILEGVTRRTLLQLAADLDIPVQEREIDRTELYVADEIFLCGTGAQVSPVTHVDRRPIGSGQPGPQALRIQQYFFDVVRGRVPAHADWLTRVALPASVKA